MKKTIGIRYLLQLRRDIIGNVQVAQRFYPFHRMARHSPVTWTRQRQEEAYQVREACRKARREALR